MQKQRAAKYVYPICFGLITFAFLVLPLFWLYRIELKAKLIEVKLSAELLHWKLYSLLEPSGLKKSGPEMDTIVQSLRDLGASAFIFSNQNDGLLIQDSLPQPLKSALTIPRTHRFEESWQSPKKTHFELTEDSFKTLQSKEFPGGQKIGIVVELKFSKQLSQFRRDWLRGMWFWLLSSLAFSAWAGRAIPHFIISRKKQQTAISNDSLNAFKKEIDNVILEKRELEKNIETVLNKKHSLELWQKEVSKNQAQAYFIYNLAGDCIEPDAEWGGLSLQDLWGVSLEDSRQFLAQAAALDRSMVFSHFPTQTDLPARGLYLLHYRWVNDKCFVVEAQEMRPLKKNEQEKRQLYLEREYYQKLNERRGVAAHLKVAIQQQLNLLKEELTKDPVSGVVVWHAMAILDWMTSVIPFPSFQKRFPSLMTVMTELREQEFMLLSSYKEKIRKDLHQIEVRFRQEVTHAQLQEVEVRSGMFSHLAVEQIESALLLFSEKKKSEVNESGWQLEDGSTWRQRGVSFPLNEKAVPLFESFDFESLFLTAPATLGAYYYLQQQGASVELEKITEKTYQVTALYSPVA